MTQAQTNIDLKKVDRDFSFLKAIIEFAKKMEWRIVVSGGYGLDILLGKITRNHNDIDVILYGNIDRKSAVNVLSKFVKSRLDKPMITIESKVFMESVNVNSVGIGADLYYVQTAVNPFLDLHKIKKLDGEEIINTEERFPSPIKGKIFDISVEVENPNSHLADILFKRKTQPHKPTHDQDITNLALVTDTKKVELILSLM